MIVDKINAYLSGTGQTLNTALLDDVAALAKLSFARQFGEREESSKAPRLSSIGRCLRQQAYRVLGFEANGKEIDARAKMVFFQGDMAELAIMALAKAAGCNITFCGKEQAEVALDSVRGHPDGILETSEGSILLVEAKSMSSYGFSEFQRGILEESYRYQCNAYMVALNLDQCVVVALNKDAGVLAEMIVSKDPEIVKDIGSRVRTLLDLSAMSPSEQNLPPRPYSPNDKGFLPWNCLYCAYHVRCWPAGEKVLVGKSYKLKLPKKETTPHVPTPA